MIRYVLDVKGVAFEEENVSLEQIAEMKAAGTYGHKTQVPIFVRDDGTYMSQSTAILKALCMEHGYGPQNPTVMYESEWFHGIIVDVMEGPNRIALLLDEPTPEQVAGCSALLDDFMDRCEARFADGRAHAAGDQITWVDFCLLAFLETIYENPRAKHEAIRNSCAAKMPTC